MSEEQVVEEVLVEDNCFWSVTDEQYHHCHYPCCHCLSCPEHEEYTGGDR